jgi:hypothetical protein
MTGFLLVCFFLSGATALVYEVVCLRILGLVFGHTVHAVATVLIVFMGGLALGSALFGGRTPRPGTRSRPTVGWSGAGASGSGDRMREHVRQQMKRHSPEEARS